MKKETIGNCELYLGNCIEILSTLGKVDAVVTDPPYGINLNTDFRSMVNKGFGGIHCGKKYDRVIGDNTPFNPAPLLTIANKYVFFGADNYLSRLPAGGSLSIWDKRLSESADKIFGSCYETIWFYPARKKDFFRYKWAGIFGLEKEDIKKRVHPTQKPIGLMERVILKLGKNQHIILDPFMGSGSTGVACVNLNRKFIGIEIDEKYFNIACERIEAANKEQPFFGGAA